MTRILWWYDESHTDRLLSGSLAINASLRSDRYIALALQNLCRWNWEVWGTVRVISYLRFIGTFYKCSKNSSKIVIIWCSLLVRTGFQLQAKMNFNRYCRCVCVLHTKLIEKFWMFASDFISSLWFRTVPIMRLVILDSADQVADWSAKYVLKKINEFKPGPSNYFVLGLPTGKPLLSYVQICIWIWICYTSSYCFTSNCRNNWIFIFLWQVVPL